jgi:LDH2 family malate/lactate/ureidoglycolate dehydrogenase
VLKKVKAGGIGIAGTFNTSTSSGAIGYVVSEIAKQGFVGLAFASGPPRMATAGSYEPIFGTNPLAISVPAKPGPVILDMSTASMAFYGLIEAQTAGKNIPDDVAYDPTGKSTTDPAVAMKGALRSFDRGYKGAGLAMIIEILAGPLAGAACAGVGDPVKNWGHLVLAIDPNLLGDRDEFIGNVTTLIGKVKATAKLQALMKYSCPEKKAIVRPHLSEKAEP